MTSSTGIVNATGLSHVRVTVTDITKSKPFYVQLLGSEPAADFTDETDAGDDPSRLYGGCAFSVGNGQIFGLRPVARAGDKFDSTRVGLDHVCLQLASMDDLRAADARLGEAGIEHGEITELGDFGFAILSVQDPDDINLELAAPLG